MNIGVGSGSEEINQKNAEIASLSQKLNDRQKQIGDLEKRLAELSAGKGLGAETDLLKKDLATTQQRLKETENQLTEARSASGGDAQLQKELTSVTNDRNELRERLKEYEIIEEDLANLKRLQQENDQLKAELMALRKTSNAPAAAPAAAATPAPAPVAEPVEEIDLEAEMAKAISDSRAPSKPQTVEVTAENIPSEEGEQKSAEELLSEFEKMLG